MNKNSSLKEAFTLVEVLVVILIIGVMFVALVPKLSQVSYKAKEVGIKSDFRQFEIALNNLLQETSGLQGYVYNEWYEGEEHHIDKSSRSLKYGDTSCSVSEENIESLINDINSGLDNSLQFERKASNSIVSNASDPWNNKYIINGFINSLPYAGYDGVMSGFYVVSFGANGKFDGFGVSREASDDLVLFMTYKNGTTYHETSGFSTNINDSTVMSDIYFN